MISKAHRRTQTIAYFQRHVAKVMSDNPIKGLQSTTSNQVLINPKQKRN